MNGTGCVELSGINRRGEYSVLNFEGRALRTGTRIESQTGT